MAPDENKGVQALGSSSLLLVAHLSPSSLHTTMVSTASHCEGHCPLLALQHSCVYSAEIPLSTDNV